jgi:hypothetical protein
MSRVDKIGNAAVNVTDCPAFITSSISTDAA